MIDTAVNDNSATSIYSKLASLPVYETPTIAPSSLPCVSPDFLRDIAISTYDVINRMQLHTSLSIIQVTEIVTEAWRDHDNVYSEMEAVAWAEGFQFPIDIADRDTKLWHHTSGDLAAMARAQHARTAADRLSHIRIDKLTVQSADTALLHTLVEGMHIFTDTTFLANGNPPPRRAVYTRLQSPINKLVYKSFTKGLVFILPTALVRQAPSIHYSPIHWTKQRSKLQGRLLGDPSNSAHDSVLNTAEVKVLVEQAWGKIAHPTLQNLVQMLLAAAHRYSWDAITLWKVDLSGAFTLLNIHPDDVHLMAYELTDHLTMIHHSGMFGWTGTPGAFDVVSRVTKAEIRSSIAGLCDMYVDDVMGVSPIIQCQQDINTTIHIIQDLLGPDSVNHNKTKQARILI